MLCCYYASFKTTYYTAYYRDKDGNIIYPKITFEGLYCSELLKDSLKWGYKITGGFKKKVFFKDFVNELFENRLKAKNNGLPCHNFALALI